MQLTGRRITKSPGSMRSWRRVDRRKRGTSSSAPKIKMLIRKHIRKTFNQGNIGSKNTNRRYRHPRWLRRRHRTKCPKIPGRLGAIASNCRPLLSNDHQFGGLPPVRLQNQTLPLEPKTEIIVRRKIGGIGGQKLSKFIPPRPPWVQPSQLGVRWR